MHVKTFLVFMAIILMFISLGRYFACSTHAITVNVISKRVCTDDQNGSVSFMYYVNDGVYGSFNCIMFDHVTPSPSLLKVC